MKKIINSIILTGLILFTQVKSFGDFTNNMYEKVNNIESIFETFTNTLSTGLKNTKTRTNYTTTKNFKESIFITLENKLKNLTDKSKLETLNAIFEFLKETESLINSAPNCYKEELKLAFESFSYDLVKAGLVITDNAKKIIEGVNNHIKTLTEESVKLNTKISDLNTEIKTLDTTKSAEIERLNETLILTIKELEAAQNLNKNLNDLDLPNKIEELENTNKSHQNENAKLSTQVLSLNETIESITQDLNTKTIENKELSESIKALNTLNNSLEENVKTAQETITDYVNKYGNLEKLFQEKDQELKNKIETLEFIVKTLNINTKNINSKDNDFAKLIENLAQELNNYKTQIDELKQAIEENKSVITKITGENTDLKKVLSMQNARIGEDNTSNNISKFSWITGITAGQTMFFYQLLEQYAKYNNCDLSGYSIPQMLLVPVATALASGVGTNVILSTSNNIVNKFKSWFSRKKLNQDN
ncbi:MAG: hypothetical protein SZ59_C0004G0031 [candidate division TM6 bacterium GW2011_GWF2_28_16]|nr:MAG: hypothetical protein SZ59_C0004G0031 [candidate division TM6 bacterium GW2011_GWF2_28_16]